MCRLMAYFGPDILVADVVLRPSRSIIKQSYEARERRNDSSLPFHLGYGNLNGDGFGIGWYSACSSLSSMKDSCPCTFTSVTPAWNNDNLNRLATKLESGLIFAHVRAAYPGMPVSEQNCHPFAHGNYLFMHNGVVAGFLDIRRQLIGVMHDAAYDSVQSFHSDSAVCFGLFLHHLPDMYKKQTPEAMLRAVQATISTITRVQRENGVDGVSLLNFVVTDGTTMIATRYASDPNVEPASLYYAEGYSYDRSSVHDASSQAVLASKTIHASTRSVDSATGARSAAIAGECDYGLAYAGTETRVCLVASEPVTSSTSDWNTVEANTALVICKDSNGILTVLKAWLANEGDHPDNHEVYRCLESVEEIFTETRERLAKESLKCSSILGKSKRLSTSGGTTPRFGLESGGSQIDEYEDPNTKVDPSHILTGHVGPVTAAISCGEFLFSGGADGLIRVWRLGDYACIKILQGHRDPIRRLDLCGTKLISAGARTLRTWSLDTFECISVIHTNLKGSITALSSSPNGTVYVGSVDCRIKMYTPDEVFNALRDKNIDKKDTDNNKNETAANASHITAATMGHCASVTCLAVCSEVLCSGSHDATIRVWSARDLSFIKVLRGHRGSVLALTRVDGFLISGGRDSVVRVWDVDTWVCCQTLRGHYGAILGLASFEDDPNQYQKCISLFASSSADGTVRLWQTSSFTCTHVFETLPRVGIHFQEDLHRTPPCMACVISPPFVVACSDDGRISLYDACTYEEDVDNEDDIIRRSRSPGLGMIQTRLLDHESASIGIGCRIEQEIEKTLRSFIKIETVSADPSKKQDCFDGAKFLLRLLETIGAEVKLAPTTEGKNPLVMGRLGNDPNLRTVTFYGHYDVQPAMEPDWDHDPFEMSAKDGYYTGRGVSDNKGPILGFIFAVRELAEELRHLEKKGQGAMPVNVAFLFEGEEENGSVGFKEAVKENARWFEGTDAILISNTLWVGETQPCITYGMRGMINLSIEIRGPSKDLHSGNEGGVFSEPLSDLTKVLASLVDSRSNVCVPGFYDDVKEDTLDIAMPRLRNSSEFSLDGYRDYLGVKELTVGRTEEELLWARWCQPTLSVVDVRVGTAEDADTAHYRFGPTRFSVIPRAAVGKVSVRFVPDQSADSIITRLSDHIKFEFAKLRSGNSINVTVHSVGDWWEADPNCKLVKLAEDSIRREWGETPLLVREGGTMPVASALEKLLNAPALLLPMGQSSDNCHLSNERIRRINLLRGKNVVKYFLQSMETY